MMEAHGKRYQQLGRENRELLAALERGILAVDREQELQASRGESIDVALGMWRQQARAAIAAVKGES